MKTFDAVIPYLKKGWKKIAVGLFVLVIVDAVQLIIPKIIQRTIDNFSQNDFTQADILKSSLFIVLLAAIIVVMRFVWRILIIGNSFTLEMGLREKFYKHLMTLSQNFFNFSKIGDLMAHATNDLNAVRMLFGMGFIAGADIILMATASFLFMITINVKLTLMAIIPLPLLSFMIGYFGSRLHRRFGKVQASFSTLSGMIQESISGIRVVKAFAQEDAELKKMQEYSNNFVKENIGMAKLSGFFHPSLAVIISFSTVIVLVFGGQAVIKGDITIGGFIAFFSYLGMLVWPMIAIGWIVDMYQRGSASLKRLNNIWETKPEIINEPETDFNINELQGSISFKNLNYKYPKSSDMIFENVTTSIDTGKTLAICGKTGSGKSTFIDLLCRVYNPPKNSIYIDNHELYTIPIEVLRKNIIMVPQDIFLFSDTVANNIALGNPSASIEEVHKAAKIAAVYDDIMEFKNGFDTVVGERGVTVSGGQKQRIAIARAILTNPKILILDDALSAVDTKTEKQILQNLLEARKNKTNIIIAHRISALNHADHIIALDKGTISEQGTHDELLQLNGLYNELYEKQKIEEKIGDVK
ncbi:MAG: ABC transporter ATP-binding protein [Candidatus Cloacimonetes bacterium]|jgi:ATP-binding cassette subfamily B protein|nr:ABC transporter ATP-binding protein/permease [Candidatus Cloacimonadota bacterium]MDD4157597.1 ABC transporter ATP-binding protein [Candidatus Cloacimonadota bacterium]